MTTSPLSLIGGETAARRTRDSVLNVTALVTLNVNDLAGWIGRVPANFMHDIDQGVRGVLGR